MGDLTKLVKKELTGYIERKMRIINRVDLAIDHKKNSNLASYMRNLLAAWSEGSNSNTVSW